MHDNPGKIEVTDLHHRFGTKSVINGISLSINQGERFAFFGSTGSGKSTLLKILSGVYPLQQGTISIDGKNVNELPLGYITTVWQSRALFPHLNVEDNIRFGLNFKHSRNKIKITDRLNWVVGLLKIEYLLKRTISQLSGGESQKVALARALAVNPDILLLDEPFTGIDKIFKTELRAELNILFKDLNKTIIIVSHDMDDLYALSDRIAVLEDGKVSQCDTPQKLHNDPSTYFVARSFGDYNIIEAIVEGLILNELTIRIPQIGTVKLMISENDLYNGKSFYLGLLPERFSVIEAINLNQESLMFNGILQSFNIRLGRIEATILVGGIYILKIFLPFEKYDLLQQGKEFCFSYETKYLKIIPKN